MKSNKVETMLLENMNLKQELSQLMELIKENEVKQKGFRLIEDSFLLAESLEEINNKALMYIEDIFNINRAVLYVRNSDISLYDYDDKVTTFERIIFVDDKVFKYAYINKKPVYGTYIDGLISDFHAIDSIGSYLIAPIIEDGNIIASLNLYSTDPEKISKDAKPDFILELALKIRIALKKIQTLNTIKRSLYYDMLTNIYNRGMISELMDFYIENYSSIGKSFVFSILNIKDFRSVNILKGHLYGDSLLKDIALKLKSILSKDEFVGRFGGDEFYLFTTDHNRVSKIWGKINSHIAHKYPELKIGVNIGYVISNEYNSDRQEYENSVINSACEALESSKRNKVDISTIINKY